MEVITTAAPAPSAPAAPAAPAAPTAPIAASVSATRKANICIGCKYKALNYSNHMTGCLRN